MRKPLTVWENEILRAIAEGRDPWEGRHGSGRTRSVSQAIARLKRKGYVEGPPYVAIRRDA